MSIGHTRSCGCLQVESVIKKNSRHGAAVRKQQSREYKAWCDMKTRCRRDERYTGRGITICDTWKQNFAQFAKDMGPCPVGMTLDRKNNNSNYEPSNCRWATPTQQANNKRNNRMIAFLGETKSITQWAKTIGLSRWIIDSRLKQGWPIHEVLSRKRH